MNRRELQRRAKREARERKLDQRVRKELAALLERYIKAHYGNPSTGRASAVLDGPVIAKLSAAATLYALLREEVETTG